MYFPYMPKGNRSEARGHRTRVGGEYSQGTIRFSVSLPVELWRKVQAKAKGFKSKSEYIRSLVEDDSEE